jgi:hypothetical protein
MDLLNFFLREKNISRGLEQPCTLSGMTSLRVHTVVQLRFVAPPSTTDDDEVNVDAIASSASAVGGSVLAASPKRDRSSSLPPPPSKKARMGVPTPRYLAVETYEADFPEGSLPSASYMRHRKLTIEEESRCVEYDADAADVAWLAAHPRYGEAAPATHRIDVTLFEILIDVLEKATGQRDGVLLGEGEASQILLTAVPAPRMATFVSIGPTFFSMLVSDLYLWWTSKRSRQHKALLRRYWPATSTEDTNPYMVFRPREKERYQLRKHRKNDMQSYLKMRQLLGELQSAQKITQMIAVREQTKADLLRFRRELFEQRLHVLKHETVESLGEKNVSAVPLFVPLRELGVTLRPPRPPTPTPPPAPPSVAATVAKFPRASAGRSTPPGRSPPRIAASAEGVGTYSARHRVRVTRVKNGHGRMKKRFALITSVGASVVIVPKAKRGSSPAPSCNARGRGNGRGRGRGRGRSGRRGRGRRRTTIARNGEPQHGHPRAVRWTRNDGHVSIGRGWAAGLPIKQRSVVVPQAYRARVTLTAGAGGDFATFAAQQQAKLRELRALHVQSEKGGPPLSAEQMRMLRMGLGGAGGSGSGSFALTRGGHRQQRGAGSGTGRIPSFFFPRRKRTHVPLLNAVDETVDPSMRLPSVTFPDFPTYALLGSRAEEEWKTERRDGHRPLSFSSSSSSSSSIQPARSNEFRYRPRLGRCGRIILDRVHLAQPTPPPPSLDRRDPIEREVYASAHSLDALPLAVGASVFGTEEPDLLASLSSVVPVERTDARRRRIDEIAAMSDSEDEQIEVRLSSEMEAVAVGGTASALSLQARSGTVAALVARSRAALPSELSGSEAAALAETFVPAYFTWSEDPFEQLKVRVTLST